MGKEGCGKDKKKLHVLNKYVLRMVLTRALANTPHAVTAPHTRRFGASLRLTRAGRRSHSTPRAARA